MVESVMRMGKKNITGRQTTGMGEGGEIKPLTLVAVCGLLATLSAMHLFLSYWICTKPDVSLVTRASDLQYHMSHKWKTELHLFADRMQGIPSYTHSPVGGVCVERRAETKQTWPLLTGTTCSLRQCYFSYFLMIRRKRSYEARSSLF